MGFYDDATELVKNTVKQVTNTVTSTASAGATGLANATNSAFHNSDTLSNLTNHPLGSLVNIATQIGTAGLAGYDPSNGTFGVRSGFVTHAGLEAAGEITGANAARDAADAAAQAVRAAQTQAAVDQANLNKYNAQQDQNASQQAQGIRNSALGPGNLAGSYPGQNIIPQQDFLGL